MQYRTTSYAEGVFDTYWFEKNLQGDIVAVYNDAGTLLVTYAYDAWGGIASLRYSNGGSSTAAQYNPFRYRGYYRDSETGFYYLNSRYYDPNTGRFVNADGYLYGSLLGNNLYAYCENSPVSYFDPYGESATDVLSWWTSIGAAIAVAEPTVFGEVVYFGGFIIIGGIAIVGTWQCADTIDNMKNNVFSDTDESTVSGSISGVVSGARLGNNYTNAKNSIKLKDKYDPNPYKRPGEKEQNRENRNKSRKQPGWEPRNNRRDGKPRKPKPHTPGKNHRKYFNNGIIFDLF